MKWNNLRPGQVVREWMVICDVKIEEFEQYSAEEGRTEDWSKKIEYDTFCYEDCVILDKVFHNGRRYWIKQCANYWKEAEEMQ